MRKCDTVFTLGGCEGHLGKYDDCIAESLDSLGLDYADEDTGSCDFEGHLMLFIFDEVKGCDVDQDGKRLSLIPAGNYILHTASGGAVSLWQYDTPQLASAEFDRWEARYHEWDSQDG